MNLIYVDDVDEFRPTVEEAGRFLQTWLRRTVNVKFITQSQTVNGLLWLRNGTECDVNTIPQELRGTKCVPTKLSIDSTLSDPESIYLLDLEFHPRHLKDYGFDLAMYLVSHGVPRDHIMLFSAFADRAHDRFTDHLSGHPNGELPIFHSYEKGALREGSRILSERLAWRIMQMRNWEAELLSEDQHDVSLPPWVVGRSRALHEIIDRCRRVAQWDSAVLITGESGTGKEVIAHTLHKLSARGNMPFVAVNCSAVPESLIESELFGHKKGAFTGAQESRKGAFQNAQGGVLFLDEIGELSMSAQPKLLRAIDNREIRPLGADSALKTNIRLVCATNRCLSELVHTGTFRDDLYYRISTIPIHLPPLRERPEDILPLARHFLKKVDRGRSLAFDPRALDLLENAKWPGNVRQLANLVERVAVFANGRVVSAELVRSELGIDGEVATKASVPIAIGRSRSQPTKAGNQVEWDTAVAQLKDGTNVNSFMSAFSSVLRRVPLDEIDPSNEAVLKIWRILVVATREMCSRADHVRSKRDGNYGLAISKLAALLSCLGLSQSEKEALSKEVGKPLPEWNNFKFGGTNANPADWPQEKKDKVTSIIRAMANITEGN